MGRGDKQQICLWFLSGLVFCALARPTQAQEAQTAGATEQDLAGAPEDREANAADSKKQSESEEIVALKEQLAETQKELEQFRSETEDRFERAELFSGGSGFDEGRRTPSFDFYGFFDLSFVKQMVDDDSFYKNMVPDKHTFVFQHLNLYFASQMTETLDTLVELRFSFLPHGSEKYLAVPATGREYERIDNEVMDPYSSEFFDVGGVTIERARVTWSPTDWFNIMAGRYITPFGIWNIEHSTAVVITTFHPFIQILELVPLAQTGVNIFGRFFPAEGLYLDYNLTISNGRGPTEATYDLDNNKGIGARLHLTFQRGDVLFSLGGYGYYGGYTDVEKAITQFEPFVVERKDTEVYTEYIGTLDALFEFRGLRLQGEIVARRVEYEVRPALDPRFGVGYPADFTARDWYGLISYELPLHRWLGSFLVRPYFMWEDMMENDARNKAGKIITAGLNLQPSPFVVLKGEWRGTAIEKIRMGRDNDVMKEGDGWWGFNFQLAISF